MVQANSGYCAKPAAGDGAPAPLQYRPLLSTLLITHAWLACSLLQSLVKSVRAEATQKMTFPAKLLCNNHAIDSRALKNIGSSSQIYV